jgi:hypothetical protein
MIIKKGEGCIMRNFIKSALTKYYWGHQVKEDDMGGECNTYGRDEKRIEYFGVNA